jgi:hypothetical protein
MLANFCGSACNVIFATAIDKPIKRSFSICFPVGDQKKVKFLINTGAELFQIPILSSLQRCPYWYNGVAEMGFLSSIKGDPGQGAPSSAGFPASSFCMFNIS